jgi:hypothetical protein
MRRIIATWVFALLVALSWHQANAQSSPTLLPGGCGTASYPNNSGYLTIDSTGHLCTSGSGGGGGGGAVTNAGTFAVQNTAATPTGTNTIGTVGQLPYPVGAVPITASATGTTAATTATLTNVTGHTTYICGYSIRANATANTNVTDTVTGVITATMSSILWVPANTAGLGVDEQIFSPCIPASAVSTSIAVVSGAPGTGGLVSVKAWGYSL